MVIKLYISRTCGNVMMHGKQYHIRAVLEAKGVEFEEVDVGDPHYLDEKLFMQQTLRISDEDLKALPPQLFNGNKYRGDYNGFFEALEDEKLYQYLDLQVPETELEYQLQMQQGS
jgi:glutaredoxin